MIFPEILKRKIEVLRSNYSFETLKNASDNLTGRYRQIGNQEKKITQESERIAYLCVRMPATFAAVSKVLYEASRRSNLSSVSTLLDVGAGPGTATLAFLYQFPALKEAMLIEGDPNWLALGKEFFSLCCPKSCTSQWKSQDILKLESFPSKEVVIASYCLSELSEQNREKIIPRLFDACQKYCIVIEPGTPKGFEAILQVRRLLIGKGAHMVAPCPGSAPCPMEGNDWCHFAARLDRSKEHRIIKQAELSYEDEKFSYVVFAKENTSLPTSRIVRHPQHYKGRVDLTLCRECHIEKKVISKSQKDFYKTAKDLNWGDALYT